MFAKLNHVALISDNYGAQSIFYKALFDLKTGSSAKFESTAIAIGDGAKSTPAKFTWSTLTTVSENGPERRCEVGRLSSKRFAWA